MQRTRRLGRADPRSTLRPAPTARLDVPNGEYRAMRFAEKSNVDCKTLKPTAQDAARLKFAPPKHKIIYG